MDNVELILKGQERIEVKLEKFIDKYSEQRTEMLMAIMNGENRMNKHEAEQLALLKATKDHEEVLKGIQRLKYKAIGAATLGGIVLACTWELTKLIFFK